MEKERLVIVDVCRGILILLVVLGHLPTLFSKYIYWFHMPAFFILSGMLLPDGTRKNMFVPEVLKSRAIKFFVPYASYFILITIVSWLFLDERLDANLMLRFFFGGRLLSGVYGTFWFITCLFASQYLVFFIQQFHTRKVYIIVILIISYFVGIYFSKILNFTYIPWNTDVSLIAIYYLFIGYLLKPVLLFEQKRFVFFEIFLISILITTCIMIDVYINPNFYLLDMKYAKVNQPVLGLIIPLAFFGAIMLLSVALSFINIVAKVLSFFGKYSLHVMYLHLLVIALLKAAGINSVLIHFLLASSIPVVSAMIFNQNVVTQFLFNGTAMVKQRQTG